MESTTLEDYVGGLNHIYIQNIYCRIKIRERKIFIEKYLSMAHIFRQ
jgi:hypothetical protein